MPVFPYGEAALVGALKTCPEDFVVTEELGFEPAGQGQHRWLFVEKRNLTTQELVERVAGHIGVRPRDVGFSGLKDKHAITRRWFSVPLAEAPAEFPINEGYRVLKQAWHTRKLRRGTHSGNFFEVRLQAVTQFPELARVQLEQIRTQGFANYFGEQRFGHRQANVAQALRSLSNSRLPRWRKSLYLSALRSHLFNHILAKRIQLGLWQEPLDGDIFMLRGSRSVFSAPVDDAIRQRHAELDISSTASLYGSGPSGLTGQADEIEREVFHANAEIVQCLDQQNVKRQMRAMRAVVSDLVVEYASEQQTLELSLRLPAGCYVTSLLDHVLQPE